MGSGRGSVDEDAVTHPTPSNAVKDAFDYVTATGSKPVVHSRQVFDRVLSRTVEHPFTAIKDAVLVSNGADSGKSESAPNELAVYKLIVVNLHDYVEELLCSYRMVWFSLSASDRTALPGWSHLVGAAGDS